MVSHLSRKFFSTIDSFNTFHPGLRVGSGLAVPLGGGGEGSSWTRPEPDSKFFSKFSADFGWVIG